MSTEPTNKAEEEKLGAFMETECTYNEDTYEDRVNHPHREYWCCEACLAKKLAALTAERDTLLREHHELREGIRYYSETEGNWPLVAMGLLASIPSRSPSTK